MRIIFCVISALTFAGAAYLFFMCAQKGLYIWCAVNLLTAIISVVNFKKAIEI